MFIGSEAETVWAGVPDLPMKIISCHLFPRRKTGFLEEKLVRTCLEKQFDPPPPPPPQLELSGSAHACLTGIIFFYFFHVAGLAEIIGRTAQMRWLICAFVVCILKSFSRNWVKKQSCKFKYTRTVNERLFRPFFSYLKASNCCGEPNFRHAPSSTFLVCEHLCPWQDCADVQARLSLRWLLVREVP